MNTMTKTHYKKLRNPNYIGSYELMTGGEPIEMVVEIQKVRRDVVQNGDKKEDAMIIELKNQKPLIVNSTNAKSIETALKSPYIEDWIGRKITLFVKKIKAFGAWQDALRVRDIEPTQPAKEDLNPLHEKWQQVIDGIKSGKATIAYAQERFSINDENLELIKKLITDEASI